MAWLAVEALAGWTEPLTLVWTVAGVQNRAQFGFSVASAGDVNGDGHDDVIVGEPDWTEGDILFGGQAHVYLGSLAGPAAVPHWTFELDQSFASFGSSVAGAGDVNGDGYDDVIVGAPFADDDDLYEYHGQALVFLGSESGLATLPIWSMTGLPQQAVFGSSVAGAGDVNGDGYDDVIVGAEDLDDIKGWQFRAYVFHGSAAGPGQVAAWAGEPNETSAFGFFSVASAGDVNGDGYDDVILGAPSYGNDVEDEGLSSVYLGSPDGLDDGPSWSVESNQAHAYLGTSVALAGDVNGDGFDDVVLGADRYDDPELDEGKVFVFHGSALGVDEASWSADTDQTEGWSGHDVASAGDVNGDGFDDIVVGGFDRVDLYHGSATGLVQVPFTLFGDQLYGSWFGQSVASAGDTNGDGYDDVIVGMPHGHVGVDGGAAFVYVGTGSGPGNADADGDGSPRPFDCDDDDAAFYPGAVEICDGKDNGCAGRLPVVDADIDQDGISTCAGDCDDDDAGIFPGAEDVCDGIDTNCDGAVDERCDEGNCTCDVSGAGAGLPALFVTLLSVQRRRYRFSAA